MKPWLRILMAVLEAAIVLAFAYCEPTYYVRGKVWGEAFYDGRSTSYWRERIDRWVENFGGPEDAASMIDFEFAADQAVTDALLLWALVKDRPPTILERVRGWLQLGDNQDDSTIMPAVLKGGDEAEPVLRELEKEARYQPIASRALAKTPPPGSRTIRTKSGIVFNIRVK